MIMVTASDAAYSKRNFYEMTSPASVSDEHALDSKIGTVNDARDMDRLGKKQELRRNFKFIPILGFSCTLMSTWEALISSSNFILTDGGLAGFIWVFLATVFAMLTVIASMADMASMAPTSGGQYHWVSEFAPRQHQKLLSYVVGWLCTLGWQSGVAVTSYVSGTLIRALITFNNPSYTAEPWHDTLFTIAIVFIAALVNIFLAKHLPWLEGIILVLHILGFVSVAVPLWVLAPTNSPKRVFTEFNDGGGWGSVGTACIIGQVACITSFMGADASAHMAEEVRDASRTVARTMITTTILNGILGLFMVITFVFAVSDLDSALASPTGYPFIEIFYVATGSKGAATTMTAIIAILTLCACISFVATASRQTYAFARDYGFFMPVIFSKVNVIGGTVIPLNAVLISLTIPIVIALLNLGSSETFFAVTSLLVAALFSSYFVSIACIFTKRLRGEPLPPSRWTMGRWTLPVNAIALCYIMFAFIMTCFPLYKDVTPKSMNWSSVVFSGVIMFALFCYVVHGRKIYKGPVVLVKETYEGADSSVRK